MSDNINNTNPPSEPLTREEEYLSAIAGVTSSDDIPEKPLTRVEKYLNKIVEDGGGSVYDKLEAGTNINIEETSDGKAKISATGEVSSEDTYAREQIADHIADKDNPHEVSAADVGLGNCDNTSDLNKPISTATQTALNLKADKTELPEVPITIVKVNNEPLVPASGAVNITVPTQASDVHALADSVKYAGASTAGGSATSAAKLDTASAGSATQPVYFANGIPTATSYSLEKSVPSNAVFTDTTYESKAAASGGTDVSLCTTGEKYTWNSKQNAIDSSHKLSADLVDDTSTTNKFATAAELEQIETNKNNILSEQAKTTNIGNATNAVINPHKNRLNYTLSSLKKINTSGTWADNVYTLNNTTFTVNDDYTITVNSTITSGNANFFLFSAKSIADLATCILSGCPVVSGASIRCEMAESPWSTICVDTGNSAVIPSTTKKAMLYIQISGSVSNIKFEPMICEPVYWNVSHEYAEPNKEVLKGKKILYNGDSICESRLTGFSANGGGYAKLIADETGCFYDNRAVSGGTLAVVEGKHNICTDVTNMPHDGDLICFEGGINDYQNNVPLGNFSETDYTSSITGLDTTTVCGALEAIIRQAIARWTGVPICFIIVHKIAGTAYTPNTAGYTFAEMREKMIAILNKYSIPYYDCYAEGGLNGYIWYLNEAYLNGGATTHPDGCHPDEGGYRRYYVPQLIDLFTRIMPKLK